MNAAAGVKGAAALPLRAIEPVGAGFAVPQGGGISE
jgi:hypothetical protein